jgi:LPXTG-motif cell wall-anchored protein
MSNLKSTLVRTAAAAAATVLVTVGGMAPALADHDHGNGSSQDHRAAGTDDKEAKSQGEKSQGGKSQGEKSHGEKSQGEKADRGAKGGQAKGGDKGQGDERGNGHTPVTVCHLLGNGSYHELTFDDNALEAHVNHGDLYPVPADGCPADSETVRTPSYHGTPGHVRVTVCNLLGNGGYHELTFDEHALSAHEAHGDLYPVPAEGCPAETTEEPVPGTTLEGDDTPAEVVADDTTSEDDATVAGVEELAGPTTAQPRDAQVLGVEAVAGVNRAAPATGPLAGILPQTGAGQLGLAAAAGLVLVGAGATLVARRRTQGA